jgi:hypothetical protein
VAAVEVLDSEVLHLIWFCAPLKSPFCHLVSSSSLPSRTVDSYKDTCITSPIVLDPDAIVRRIIIFVLMKVG